MRLYWRRSNWAPISNLPRPNFHVLLRLRCSRTLPRKTTVSFSSTKIINKNPVKTPTYLFSKGLVLKQFIFQPICFFSSFFNLFVFKRIRIETVQFRDTSMVFYQMLRRDSWPLRWWRRQRARGSSSCTCLCLRLSKTHSQKHTDIDTGIDTGIGSGIILNFLYLIKILYSWKRCGTLKSASVDIQQHRPGLCLMFRHRRQVDIQKQTILIERQVANFWVE